jgi:hypothetical protein
MPQLIEVPNHGVVEFPDGMSEADIVKAIKKNSMSYKKDSASNSHILPTSSKFIGDEAINPTQGNSFLDNASAGTGKGMTDLYLGGKQALAVAGNAGNSMGANIVSNDTVADIQNQVDQKRQIDAPLMETGGGKVGNFVGQGVPIALTSLIPGANTYAGSAIIGGLTGAAQPTLQRESRQLNIGFGLSGGVLGKYAGDKLGQLLVGSKGMSAASASSRGGGAKASATVSATPTVRGVGGGSGYGSVGDDVSAGLNIAQTQAMEVGKKLGFKMTPGQATGSKALQQFEAKLESQPMTSGAFNELKSGNQKVLNRISAASIGEKSDVLDSTVLSKALDRISGTYKMVANDTVRKIDPDDFLGRLAKVETDYEGLLPTSISDNPLVKRLYNSASQGGATGKQLQDIASKLGRAANNQMTSANGDRQLGMALFDVKNHVDDLLEQGLKGKTKETFSRARGEYRNLMLLTQRNGVLNPSSGDVSGNALAGLLQQKDRKGFMFGKNGSDLYEAARFAQAFRPIVGDSGTATRSQVMNPTDFVLSLPFNLATKAYTSGPSVSAATMAANASKNGIAPLLDPRLAMSLPYAGLLSGSVAGANAN